MPAKSVRNLIITLVILAAGIKLIAFIAQSSIPAGLSVPEGLKNSIEGVSTLVILGIAVLVLILIPVYLSKRSGEKKTARAADNGQS